MTATITVRAILSNVFYKLCGKMHLHVISGSLQDSECCVNGFLLISNFFSLDEIETCNQGVFSQQFVGYDTFHATIIFFCSVKQNNKTTKAMISVVGGRSIEFGLLSFFLAVKKNA